MSKFNASYPKTARAFKHLVIENANKTSLFTKLNLEIFNMGKFLKFFWKFFCIVVIYIIPASIMLGLGIVGVHIYTPEVLSADSVLGVIGFSILLGLPFITCFVVLLSFVRLIKRMDEEAEYEEEEEEVVKETRAERKIRKLCEKLEKEGVFVIW